MTAQPCVWLPTVRSGTGADVFTVRLCHGLNARGIRAEITWLPHRAEFLPWTVRVPPPPPWANIVHVSTWLHSRFVPSGMPAVATLHHSVHDPELRPYKGLVRAAYHRLWIAPGERRAMQRASAVVAVSQFAAEMARRTLCEREITVVHNGVDSEFFRPRHRRSVPHVPFRLLYVGSWMARKGVDLLAPLMRELGDRYVLNYTGGAGKSSRKRPMPDNMIDLGRLSSEQVVDAMHRADAFVFPSRSEGFGLVVAEAMACGLPAVATRGSSLLEVVEDRVSGILCPPNDVLALARAVRSLQSSPDVWQRMSKNAYQRATRMFTLDCMIDRYQEIYAGVLARRRSI